MPTTVTYPGVYIEELSSGVHTITGVSTSIAAFVGWAAKGPTDKAQRVTSWADYERYYGGLDSRSLLGQSVYQFFTNGGTDAYIIRLSEGDEKAKTTLCGLAVEAKNGGEWANDYVLGAAPSTFDPTRFQVTVEKPAGTILESFADLSMDLNDRRYVGTIINNGSQIVNIAANATGTTPTVAVTAPPMASGDDGTVFSPNSAPFQTALNARIVFLDRIDLFNLLCVPGESDMAVLGGLEGFCQQRRAFLIADCDADATFNALSQPNGLASALTGPASTNAAFYFPWLQAPNPLKGGQIEAFPPCGFVAGLYARTDTNRGVWKAPAGTEAGFVGVTGVKETLTDTENGILNKKAINCIRTFPVHGTIAWGARTLQGNDERGSEWKYIPVRRTALFIEETLFRNMKWVVFEPNDEPLWAQIRLNVGAFMHDLFIQGAFQGKTPRDAYLVKCDRETTTQNDINRGIVNIFVGFAPLKPAEFVIIKLQQMAGQIDV